jgi:hypothetical protein
MFIGGLVLKSSDVIRDPGGNSSDVNEEGKWRVVVLVTTLAQYSTVIRI